MIYNSIHYLPKYIIGQPVGKTIMQTNTLFGSGMDFKGYLIKKRLTSEKVKKGNIFQEVDLTDYQI